VTVVIEAGGAFAKSRRGSTNFVCRRRRRTSHYERTTGEQDHLTKHSDLLKVGSQPILRALPGLLAPWIPRSHGSRKQVGYLNFAGRMHREAWARHHIPGECACVIRGERNLAWRREGAKSLIRYALMSFRDRRARDRDGAHRGRAQMRSDVGSLSPIA
jgi:hypothetical protein